MTIDEVFEIMPGEPCDWIDVNDGVYRYMWSYNSPRSVLIENHIYLKIKDRKVIEMWTR